MEFKRLEIQVINEQLWVLLINSDPKKSKMIRSIQSINQHFQVDKGLEALKL